jgi:pimeloyl-ACP methyl ester carboxylesterase
MTMIERSVLGHGPRGFHRIAYTQWGRANENRTVLCLHGTTRNGRDFDWLASGLSPVARVVCPDLAGRGHSAWLDDSSQYVFSQHIADLTALIARLDVEQIDIVGTSMGGLLGMMLAAQPNSPVRRLVINDVGPTIAREGLERIAEYVEKPVVFEDLAGLEAYLRFVMIQHGPVSDRQWRLLAEHSSRVLPDGRLGLAYDPAIGKGLLHGPLADADLWPQWEAIRCPVLVLRGDRSDVLTAETAGQMARRGRDVRVITLSGVGHAPALMDEPQIRLVRDFLDRA